MKNNAIRDLSFLIANSERSQQLSFLVYIDFTNQQ